MSYNNNYRGKNRGRGNKNDSYRDNNSKVITKEIQYNNNNEEEDFDINQVNTNEEEITETLVVFPGEKFPFTQEYLTQGNFFLKKEEEKENNGETKLIKYLVSKNFFSLSFCKTNSEKFNMTSQLQGKYYSPKIDDLIIGTIINKAQEQYKVDISSYSSAILGTSEFEGASKKTKPNLKVGDLIFAKVLKANKFDSPLLTCISGDGKNWSSGEAFFGVINAGHVFRLPLNTVNLYFYKGEKLFSRINDAVEFEYNLGHNGNIVINTHDITNIPKIKEIIILWGEIMLSMVNKGVKLNEENTWLPELEKLLNKNFMKE